MARFGCLTEAADPRRHERGAADRAAASTEFGDDRPGAPANCFRCAAAAGRQSAQGKATRARRGAVGNQSARRTHPEGSVRVRTLVGISGKLFQPDVWPASFTIVPALTIGLIDVRSVNRDFFTLALTDVMASPIT